MEEPKYYTPAIDHFHIGFEYEWKNTDNFPNSNWMQGVVKDGKQIDDIFNSIYDVRVKHLDRSDIESEGWETQDKNAKTDEVDGWLYCAITTPKDEYFMSFCPQTNIAIISDIDENLFVGTIRNISELRRLMKQLNIK